MSISGLLLLLAPAIAGPDDHDVPAPHLDVVDFDAALLDAATRYPVEYSSVPAGMSTPIADGCLPAGGRGPVALPIAHIAPLAREVGQWSATRLTPPAHPFDVTSVGYYLADDSSAGTPEDATIPHLVRLFVDGPSPSATPAILTTYAVALETAVPGLNLVTIELEHAVRLHDGESLYVMIEGASDGDARLSVAYCNVGDGDEAGYWSNTTSAPYPWSPLSDFGYDLAGDPMVHADGSLLIAL